MAIEMHSPLAQFIVEPVYALPMFQGVDMSVTNSALVMILGVAAVWLFYAFAMRKKSMVPGRLQSFAEVIYEFVEEIVGENAGKEGMKYFPFMFTLFLFISALNILGLFPFSFAPTSHIIVTLGLGATVFIGIVLIGIFKQGPVGFFKHFLPAGIPIAILPLLFVIEMVSFLSRPFSLAIRLAANIGAGHTLMAVMAGFVLPMGVFGVLPMAFLLFMSGLEFFVAILQAYVFTLLACLYLGEALGDHDHDEHEDTHTHAVLEAEDTVHVPV
jgi:F-type H+-transporting ATPase subunit a